MSEAVALTFDKTVPVTVAVDLDDVLRGLSDAQLKAECARRGLLPRPSEALDGAVLRAARGLLDWSLADLAAASGVSVSTIKRVEDEGPSRSQARKLDALRRALRDAGVEITSTDGVLGLRCAAHLRSN